MQEHPKNPDERNDSILGKQLSKHACSLTISILTDGLL